MTWSTKEALRTAKKKKGYRCVWWPKISGRIVQFDRLNQVGRPRRFKPIFSGIELKLTNHTVLLTPSRTMSSWTLSDLQECAKMKTWHDPRKLWVNVHGLPKCQAIQDELVKADFRMNANSRLWPDRGYYNKKLQNLESLIVYFHSKTGTYLGKHAGPLEE